MGIITSDIDQPLADFLFDYDTKVPFKVILDTQIPGEIILPGESNTNWDRIKRRYTDQELLENEPKYPTGEVLIKQGTSIVLLSSQLRRDPERQPIVDRITISDFKPFIAQQLHDLLNDPKYVRKSLNADNQTTEVVTEYNEVTCFIWCRALNDWIDASRFISTAQTAVSKSGGAFSVTFTDTLTSFSELVGWFPENDEQNTGNLISKFSKEGESRRNNFYFNTILAENDLVYIRFETLELDTNNTENINPANQVWDMIGLIDTIGSNNSPSSAITSIQGRDLMKMLIEDGSIFFTSQFLGNIFTNPNSLLAKRNLFSLIEQEFIYAFPTFQTISSLLKYVLNKYSNLGLIPNSAFLGYGSSLTLDKYNLQTSKLKSKNLTGGSVVDLLNENLSGGRQGLWRIIDFVFDDEPANRLVTDPSFSQDNGSIINSIKKIVQEPLVEIYGDTYGDQYRFTVRKPPFDKKGYTGLVYGDVVTEERQTGGRLNSTTQSRASSKLKKKISKEIKRRLLPDQSFRESSLSNFVIDIDDSEVLSHSLQYHKEAYSWYRTIPIGLGVLDEDTQFLLAPIVSFDEYAEIWGSKTFSMEYNYTPVALLEDAASKVQFKYAETQAFLDLQYMVQSSQYLPFTRQGTITLIGNRTIKRGLFIFFKPTQEVFYVDEVVNTRSIGTSSGENQRMTTLKVSRGMREKYIKGTIRVINQKPTLVSYFNIINTTILNAASINSQDVLKNWRVNKDVFDFFVQRRQWRD